MTTSAARPAARVVPIGTMALAAGLAAAALAAWLLMLRGARTMVMPGARASLAEGALFTLQWGTMMAAMMLPSAAPMILLYRTVSRRLATQGDRAIPAALFAAVYLASWLATGVPVYGAWVATGALAARSARVAAALPWAVAAVLALAGLYQLTAAKRACLRHCESPLSFLMRRWRSGYGATLRLAAAHAGWCIGCCWGLMAILVAAGAMSLPWVVAITLVVLAEKTLPARWPVARVVGVALLLLGAAVALQPTLALTMRGRTDDGMHRGMDMR